MDTSHQNETVFAGETTDQAWSGERLDSQERTVRTQFWDKLRRFAGRIPFVDDLVAAYYCALDTETPLRVRGMLFGALAYFIMPFDAVPDVIAGLGLTDDAAVLAAVVSLVSGHIQPRHRAAAAKALGKELPESLDADQA